MEILWATPALTIQEILDRVRKEPKPAYTSLLTVVRTMTDKGHLIRHKDGKGHRYSPAIARSNVRRQAVGRLVTSMFAGRGLDLAVSLIKDEHLDPAEIRALRALLDGMAK